MTRPNGDLVLQEPGRELIFDSNESIDFSCPGRTVTAANSEFATAQCVSGTDWNYAGSGVQFNQLGCSGGEPSEDTHENGRTCGPSSRGIEVELGFDTEDGFEALSTVCFDEDPNSVTYYAQHLLHWENPNRDTGGSRPSFREDGYYPTINADDLYSKNTQADTIQRLTGKDTYVDTGSSSDTYLARGHLAPNADMNFGPMQDSTFYFVNCAPQWQSFNAGNWGDSGIEGETRAYLESKNKDLMIYTGTSGVLELDNTSGSPVEIYLDDSGNRIPVPMYYWKVVVDEGANTGMAFIGVNNVHITSGDISRFTICTTQSHTIINGISNVNDIAKGVVYACLVDDAMDAIPEIPSSLRGLGRLAN